MKNTQIILTCLVLLSLMTANCTKINGQSSVRSVLASARPKLTMDFQAQDIQEIIYNALDGMMVFSYIYSSKSCVDNINYFVNDLINSSMGYIWMFGDYPNRQFFEWGTFNFTNSLGRLSPILRNCYEVGGQVDKNWEEYWAQWDSVKSVYQMIKANVVRNYTDIDSNSSLLYNSTRDLDLPDMSFSFSRLTLLFLFQSLVSDTTTLQMSLQAPGPMPKVEVYPAWPVTYDYLNLGSLYFYEFLSGTRLQDQTQLDQCQQNITDFSKAYHEAIDYYNVGKANDDYEQKREGVFRVADSFMRITNMTWQCYTVYLLVEYTLQTDVKSNLFNPVLIITNCAVEFFYILSDFAAEFANFNYEDWLSFAYWLGDLVYRILVVDNSSKIANF